MRILQKYFSMACICVVLINLCACKGGNKVEVSYDEDSVIVGADLQGEGGSPLYKKTEIDQIDSNVYFSHASRDDNCIFLSGTNVDTNESNFYSFDIDTKTISKIPHNAQRVWRIAASQNGNLFVLESIPIEGSQNVDYRMTEITKKGELVSTISLDSVLEFENTVITDFLPIENGIMISMINSVIIIDENGEIKKTFDYTRKTRSLNRSADGTAVICGKEEDGYIVEEISSSFELKRYVINGAYFSAIDGQLSDGLYLVDQSNIYSVNYKDGTRQAVMNLIAAGVSPSNFVAVNESMYFSLENGVPALWEPKSKEEMEKTVVLKLATFNMDTGLHGAVLKFNSDSDFYKIDVVDYAMYNTGENDTTGLTVLNTEIMAGNIPDILDLSRLPGNTYISKGMLQNLIPYIENDPDIKRDDFVKSAIDALSVDDSKLYDFVPGFELMTMVGGESLSKYVNKWTPNAFLDCVSANTTNGTNILPASMTREDFIEYILSFSGKDYVNYDKAEANFNSPSFIKLLEYTKNLISKDELDYDLYMRLASNELNCILEGTQLLSVIGTKMPVLDLITSRALFGGNMTILGFPSADGGGCAITPYMRLGMSESSAHKDGIWEFFSFLIQPEFQERMYAIPIVRKSLEDSIANQVAEYSKAPLMLSVPINDGMSSYNINCEPPDENTAKQVMALINSIDCVNEYDIKVFDIILEEASAFFAGERSAEDTARLIQSRVSLYLAEKG